MRLPRVYTIVTALTFAVPSRTSAQVAGTPRNLGGEPRHQSFVAITVADLDASVRWYETYLGARRIASSRAPSGFAENATVANDYLMAELIHFAAKAKSDTALREPRDIGLQKAGVWVEAPTFDSTLARLRRLNATFVGGVFSDTAIRGRSFIVKDNSGVLIQFFAPIP